MKNIFILLFLFPTFLNANLETLKKELEFRYRRNLIEINIEHSLNRFFYLKGQCETYYEIIELIDQMEMENAKKKESAFSIHPTGFNTAN